MNIIKVLNIIISISIALIAIVFYIKTIKRNIKYTIIITTDYNSYTKEIITSIQYQNIDEFLKDGRWIKKSGEYYIIKEQEAVCIPAERVKEIIIIEEELK
ncbi:MAG: hypothetical protein ACK5MV_04340 [Aminipila sp.]